MRRTTILFGLWVCLLTAGPASAGAEEERRWIFLGPGTDANIIELKIDPLSPATLFATDFDGGKFKSSDGGRTWNPFEIDSRGGRAVELAIDPEIPSTLYAAISTDLDSDIYKSMDGGDTWVPANGGLSIFIPRALAIDPQNPSTVYVGETSQARVFRSFDRAASWQPVGFPEITHHVVELVIDPVAPSTIYVGTHGGGVFKSLDGGNSWFAASEGIELPYVVDLDVSPGDTQVLYVTTTQPGIVARPLYKTTDGGESWTVSIANRVLLSVAVDPQDPSIVYAGRQGSPFPGGIIWSEDGGTIWRNFHSGLEGRTVRVLALDPLDPKRVYAGTDQGVYVLSDPILFADGFESGDTMGWSETVSSPMK